jgi:hypothetical protein
MADEAAAPSVLLTTYTIDVFLREAVADDELDVLIDNVDDALYDGLFRLAQRLEQQLGVMVVAVDEDGSRWISGGIASGPALAADDVRLPEEIGPGVVDA